VGATLLERTTRRRSLTEDGRAFLGRARAILQSVGEATEEISRRRTSLTGRLRLSCPVSFGVLHLGPALFSFSTQNPGIELTVELDDRFVDIAADGYDAVVRHGPVQDSRLVAKRLASSRRVLVASPSYLERHGSPGSLEELRQHRAILYTHRGGADWRFKAPKRGRMSVVRATASLRVNDGLLMRDAALAGMGIALLPTFLVSAQLASSALVPVDVGAEPEGAVLHLAYARNQSVSAKLRALTACLRLAFGDPPYWDRQFTLPERPAAVFA
jgi:DNA-binding transcriptional LysR family regulator